MVTQVLTDNFGLLTWIAFRTVIQGVASLTLPPGYALLPAVGFLLHRILRTLFMYLGLVPNPYMDDVLMGKFTAQIPARDGSSPRDP